MYQKIGFYSKTVILAALLLALNSLQPWFFWGKPIGIVLSILLVILCVFRLRDRLPGSIIVGLFGWIIFCLIYAQFFIDPLPSIVRKIVCECLPIACVLLFSPIEKEIFIKWLINAFSIILIISLSYFLFRLTGIFLPHTILNHPDSVYEPFINYFIFIVGEDWGIFTRFSSIFAEPGHVGMACSLLLYINNYSLKSWQNIAMTLSLILTFSLAGYLLYSFGFIIYILCKSKSIVKTSIKIFGICSIIGVASWLYYSPKNDDIVSTLILSRLIVDKDKGVEGNNRNTPMFELFYDGFEETWEYYVGIGSKELWNKFAGTPNSSYRNFIVGHGILGTIALLLFGICLIYVFPTRMGLGLFLLMFISFLQRPYALWSIEALPYVCALSTFYYKENKF